MAFSLSNIFSSSTQTEQEKEISKIFAYLISITEQKDITTQYVENLKKIQNKADGEFDSQYIPLYLVWENFLVTQGSMKQTGSITPHEIREQIKKQADLEAIDKKFRLLFLPQVEQATLIYEIFIQYIAKYIIKNSGVTNLTELLQGNKQTIFKSVIVTKEGLDFSAFNEELKKNPIYEQEITVAFKGLYTTLFNVIESSFGTKIAAGFFNQIYRTLQEIYNRDIAAIFLRILPEQVLGFDEWLATLSKQELEHQVKEKTEALEKLNDSLEEKVSERTKELEIAYEELKELDKKKTEFISVAAHQLRTPLSGFKWTFDMLVRGELGNLSEDQMALIKRSYDTNERMISIVNDLLNTDLILTGKSEYEFSDVSINKIIDEILSETESLAKQSNITITRDDESTKDVLIQADQKQIETVVQNILDNAIKYTRKDGAIKIHTSSDAKQFTFTVEDNGIGIPQIAQGNICDKFFRADNAIRTHANGSGLGLFIAKSIIMGHSGSITFQSKEGVGSTFTFILPIKQPDLNAVEKKN